ncbi:MAG: Lnb N-terminal periplasmic domain-containing protein [Pirellulaceae bacterium]
MDSDDLNLDFGPRHRATGVRLQDVSAYLVTAVWCLWVGGCAAGPHNTIDEILKPSNNRNWKASMEVLPSARVRDDRATIYNVRNCTYLDEDSYVVTYEDRTYDLDDIQSLDFIMCPFKSSPSLAHTMLSFGFRDGRYLGVSIEVRLEEGESYSAVGGTMRQFEIIYVLADERDLIQLRTEVRDSDVYVYRCRFTPDEVRALFIDILKRVNTLKKHPEFYDTLANNCTTNIVAHVNRVRPGAIPWQPGSLLTGYADQEAYRLGLLVDYGSFEATKQRAHINDLARRHAQEPLFSARIRTAPSETRTVRRTEKGRIR